MATNTNEIKKDLDDIKNKVTDIHLTLPDEQQKKRKINTFFTGILLGIGISLMVEAGLQFLLKISETQAYTTVLNRNEVNFSALTLTERLPYEIQAINLLSNNIILYSMALVGLILITISVALHFHYNKDLLKNIYTYRFKLAKNRDLLAIFRKSFSKKGFFGNKKLKIKDSFDYDSNFCKIRIYSPFLFWMFGDSYANWITIAEDKLEVSSKNSKFNKKINDIILKELEKLKKQKKFTELRIIRKI
ncbi:hypothetical protein GOV09_03895 [Candidatus Woesearchaeota archaeon]|nr:hypothetical protein [Candidatus Woesearchaeota archaeon]